MISPPASGPSIGPTRPGIATKLMARTSSDLGKARTMVRRPTGSMSAPPMPCRMRQATRTWIFQDRPQSNEPRLKTPIALENTRRVPKRLAVQPLTGMNTARLSV